MPWPKPQFMQVAANSPPSSFYCMVKSQFSIGSSLVGCDLIEKNILHYMNVIFPPKLYVEGACDLKQHRPLTQLKIDIKDNFCPGKIFKAFFSLSKKTFPNVFSQSVLNI
jgi:hypothetical protein